MQFAKLPPLAKAGLWCGLVIVAAEVVQAAAWLLGLDFRILSGSGRGLLLAMALAGLLAVMAADKRPVSQFGLFVGPRWKKRCWGGLGVGAVTMIAYLGIAAACGSMQINLSGAVAARLPKALLSAMTVIPLALVQQVLFSGYLLSVLRERYRAVTAVLVCGFVFAVIGRINRPDLLIQGKGQLLVIGLFLVGTLLGILRLLTGNIVFPSGLLAGWMFIDRLGKQSGFLQTLHDAPWAPWLAPYGDVRQAPMLWLALTGGITVCGYLLILHGETRVAETVSPLPASFKRIFPFAHSSGLATLDVWLRCLIAARFRVGLVYVPRLLACLLCSTINTVLSLPERLLLPLLLRNRKIYDPLVIAGFHRSGTTHLHNLMSLDPQFCTPRSIHVMNPAGCAVSGWLVGLPLAAFMPWKRPMDSVRCHLFSPQEEEFGIAGLTPMSPHWGMTFPQQWPLYERYIFPDTLPPRDRNRWKRQMLTFLKRVTVFSPRRRLLLKNPYSTGRVKILSEMFPGVQFVHIHRHPHDVYRSNQHLAREGHVVNQLQDPQPDRSYEARFLHIYRAMEEVFYRDAAQLPPDRVTELGFEELETDPIKVLRQVYAELNLAFTSAFLERLERYLARVADYKKNHHREMPEHERRHVDAMMGPLMKRWGYSDAGTMSDAA